MKKLTALCVPFFVIACQTMPEQPRLQVVEAPKVETIKVPVPQPCVSRSDLPPAPRPTKIDLKTASKAQVAAAAGLDLRAQDEYIAKINAMLAPCLH